jgi:Lsr2
MPDDVVMATKTLIVDDLDGSDGASTVSFSLGNTAYEIDLSKKNKAVMEKKLSKFTAAARKAGSSGQALEPNGLAFRHFVGVRGSGVRFAG